jgi:hypothetical protein
MSEESRAAAKLLYRNRATENLSRRRTMYGDSSYANLEPDFGTNSFCSHSFAVEQVGKCTLYGWFLFLRALYND